MKNAALKILNPILGLLVLSQLLTGMLHGHLSDELFEVVHKGGGSVLVVAAALHLLLNWSWVRNAYFRRKKRA